jgi:DNA-binding FadR family transcriptional regulator
MAQRKTVSQLVQDYVRDYIVSNDLKAGDQLPPEGEIASELEVSRVSVREAVKVLQALGIVEVRHGNGLFVRGLNLDALLEILSFGLLFDPSSLKELYQIRVMFEVSMLAEVIKNIQGEDIQACRKLLKTWEEKIITGQHFAQEDRLFHVTLCQSIGNRFLVELENIFWIAYRDAEDRLPMLHDLIVDPVNMDGGLNSHIQILDAVEAGDLLLAQQLMRQHFENGRQRLEAVEKNQVFTASTSDI